MKIFQLITFSLGLILVCSFGKVQAQDPIYSQHNTSGMYTNPGFVGLSGSYITGTVGYRNQWKNLGTGYQSGYASLEYATLSFLNLGVLIDYDYTGKNALTSTGFSAVIGYMLPLTNAKYNRRKKRNGTYWFVQPALKLGFTSKGFYSGYVNVDDVLNGNANYGNNEGLSALFPNVSMGVILSNNEYWFGIAADHLISRTNNESEDILKAAAMKLTAHLGLLKEVSLNTKAGANAIWRSQAGIHTLDFTTNVIHQLNVQENEVNLGLTIGIRTFLDGQADDNRDALILGTNISYNILKFGYSYDHTISDMTTYASGSHEITLTIIPSKDRRENWQRKFLRKNSVYCPRI